MTQKERLVEDVKLQIFAALGNVNCDTCVYKDYDMEPCKFCHIEYNQWAISKDTLQNLAESIVKRAIKNGVIVPIFQIGEKIFVIDTDDEIRERTVSALFFRKKVCVVYTCGSGILGTVYEQSHPKGAGLYRTREEAEKALKEAQNG